MYGLCVWFASARSKMPHAPPPPPPPPKKNGSRNGPLSGTFPPIPATWCRQLDIDENETNCVNYKYCLVDVTGVSDSCIE